MAQATTEQSTPARFGRAFREILNTAHALTGEQIDALTEQPVHAEKYTDASNNLDVTLDLIGIGDALITEPLAAYDAVYAVLARDRGLLTAADFATLTEAWTSTGLPLPDAATGDTDNQDDPIKTMTSDRIADELLNTASLSENEKFYGATLALTGYNFGELLAYESVRHLIDRRAGDHRLRLRWDEASRHLLSPSAHGTFADLTDEAHAALGFAVKLVRPEQGKAKYLTFFSPYDTDNAEVMTYALAHAVGAQHLLNPNEQTITGPDE